MIAIMDLFSRDGKGGCHGHGWMGDKEWLPHEGDFRRIVPDEAVTGVTLVWCAAWTDFGSVSARH